ncbi:MAG: hypothetical protein C6W55_05790 [Thermobacillus sp.]|uniref:Copper amine oxidase family protein n=1 Tax=Thermobacillus composti (strain DSM 18247 / JCM 13945 / KWC4) TaxID=717605 RepID=L0ED95_THECK|nr:MULTISPECIES: stalk domain-containing protein [Thermobacillus]AGA57599.1 copper amine oxidase family protein [Thermobacillus composti KWC4]REK57263.1 MAG: hypothetical protein C6W55_05790 [Thermobacillus sp.]
MTTIAGTGILGLKDGSASQENFYYPMDVAVSPSGVIYVADTLNYVIRKIENGRVTTLNAQSGRVAEVFPGVVEPAGDYRDGAFLIADGGNNRIRIVRPYAAPARLEGSAIEIVHNRTVLESDAEPIAVGGTTFVPVRVISEELGYTVEYGANGVTTLKQGDAWYRIRVGSKTVESSSGSLELPQAPF